jgi:hypothetical protein
MIKFCHDPVEKMCIGYMPASEKLPARSAHVFKMSTALCHKHDNYVKKIARQLVEENMNSGNFVLVRVPSNKKPNEYFRNIANIMGNADMEYAWDDNFFP